MDPRELPAADGSKGRIPLLTRARRLFGLFCALLLVVEVLEWLDAGTPVWPQRATAAAALVVIGLWATALVVRERAGLTSDAVVVVSLFAAGWGFGRSGAILALLLGTLQLRALFGGRASVALATSGVSAAFLAVEALHRGPAGAFQLGSLVVISACLAIVVVIRLLGELLTRHDLETAWHLILTEAAAELVGATSLERVAEITRTATERIASIAHGRIDAGPERAAAERRLRADAVLAEQRVRSEQRYRVLAEHSRDGIYILELAPQLAYRYLNRAGADLIGIEPEAVLADPFTDRHVMHPSDRRAMARARVERGVFDEPVHVRMRGTSGEERWVEIHEQLVDDPGGSRTVLGTLRDVTEQRREQESLRRTVEQEQLIARELRHIDEMKSTFLRAVSHELRTPLAAVLGAAETLDLHRDQLRDRQRDLLIDVVRRQAARLERLLTDLLDVDRLTRGVVAPRRSPTELLPLVHRVVASQEETSHTITVDGEAVTLDLDEPKVERIVDNLVRNALKHTPAGGNIWCSLARTADGIRLTVADDGPGIPAELRDAIFAPFTQGPAAGSQPSPGTGIGLTLVSKFAELHGGRVSVDERPGGGARFTVELPGSAAVAAPTSTGLPAAASG